MGIKFKKGNWLIDYYVNGRRKREKIGPDKKLAEMVLKKRRVEIAENKYLDVKRELRVKFNDFADEYLAIHSKINNRSWETGDKINIKCLKCFFGDKFLHEITPLMVDMFKIERNKDVSNATTNRALALLKAMFNKANQWGRFDGNNPVKGVKFLKEQARLRFLEKEEIAKLIENSAGYLRSIIILAVNTGMRKGEMLKLKWRDIDFQRNIIYLYETKNGEKREVPMNDTVKTALMKISKNEDSPYIFCNKKGLPYTDVRKSFFTACSKSGIINFRFHDLRHTFASQAVMSGIDLNTVRELLGHKSLEMTLRYSHLSPDHKKRAVDLLGSRLDTFWTPEEKTGNSVKIDPEVRILNTNT